MTPDPVYSRAGVIAVSAVSFILGMLLAVTLTGANTLGALTFVVSVLVLAVSYSQWRTANQKVVIELFDRRKGLYSKLEAPIVQIIRHGAATHEDYQNFVSAKFEAQFLFGKEIAAYLSRVLEAVVFMNVYDVPTIQTSPNAAQLFNKRTETMVTLSKFFVEAPEHFAPYIRLDQRNTPFWRPW